MKKAQQILQFFADDNGFESVDDLTRRDPELLTKMSHGIEKLEKELGRELLPEDMDLIAAGGHDEQEELFGSLEGYVLLDEILNSLM